MAGPASVGRAVGPTRGSVGAWLWTARPHTLWAAAAPIVMGGALAHADGAFAPGPFLAAVACGLLLQVGTNFANDYSDYVRGADAEDRVGFVRATQAGLLTPRQVRAGVAASFGLACLPGLYLAAVAGWPVLAIGVVSMAAGLAYTGGPWPLGYHGLGELCVFVFFGLVAVSGTYYVQALAVTPGCVAAGTAAGALTAAILVVNNLRDRRSDARAGKRTLAVLLGVGMTRAGYTGLLAAAALVPPLGVLKLGWPATCLAALVALALAFRPLRAVWTFRDPELLNGALADTARITGLYGMLFALGLLPGGG